MTQNPEAERERENEYADWDACVHNLFTSAQIWMPVLGRLKKLIYIQYGMSFVGLTPYSNYFHGKLALFSGLIKCDSRSILLTAEQKKSLSH